MRVLSRRAHAFRRLYSSLHSSNKLTIGIRREDPQRIWERRCPLTPEAVSQLVEQEVVGRVDGHGDVEEVVRGDERVVCVGLLVLSEWSCECWTEACDPAVEREQLVDREKCALRVRLRRFRARNARHKPVSHPNIYFFLRKSH